MNSLQELTGVGVAGMSWTLHVADAPFAAYPAIPTSAARQAKRRNAAGAVASVNRGTI